MQAVFVYTTILSFAAGIAWQDMFELNAAFAAFLLVLGLALIIVNISAKTAKPCFAVLAINILIVGIFAFTLGVVRMEFAQDARERVVHTLDTHFGAPVVLEGIVVDEPDIREYSTNIIVEVRSTDGVTQPAQVLVKASAHMTFAYGDGVTVQGVLQRPQNFTGDTGREFDYVGYLAKDDVHYLIKHAKVEVVSHHNGSKVKAALFGIKGRYVDTLSEMIPEPQAGLAAGITVGAKRALGSELVEAFRNTGLIHIVVLSGFNITIIIVFLLRAFAWLPRFARYSLATCAVVLFAVLTGADAPVVRASAMGLLGVAALTLGRTYAITRALMLVVLAMIAWNPYILLHDIAFQLSVIATLGLIFLSPPIINYLGVRLLSNKVNKIDTPIRYSFIEIISITIAAQIAVLPLLIFYMGEVSVVAVVVNVLALPVIPVAMLATFLAGALGMVSPLSAIPFAYATHFLLAYIVWLVEFFNALPITTVQIF